MTGLLRLIGAGPCRLSRVSPCVGVSSPPKRRRRFGLVRDEPRATPIPPVLSVLDRTATPEGGLALRYVDLPVRVAVASGIQTEEVIREIQLDQGSPNRRPAAEVARFFALVDRSAPVRSLGGTALETPPKISVFDLELHVATKDALQALPELARALALFDAERLLPTPAPLTSDVVKFRAWLEGDERQLAGDPPTPRRWESVDKLDV